MLKQAVLDRTRTLVGERLKGRDQALLGDLNRLAEKFSYADKPDDELRLTVQLRLLCEQDLMDRAQIIWGSLRNAHKDVDGIRREGLVGALRAQLDSYMREGGVALAEALRDHSDRLASVFTGPGALDADWLAIQRDRAAELMATKIVQYVESLRWGFGARLKRLFR